MMDSYSQYQHHPTPRTPNSSQRCGRIIIVCALLEEVNTT